MRAWCNLLPVFLVRRIVRWKGERFHVEGVGDFVQPFPDVMILVKQESRHE